MDKPTCSIDGCDRVGTRRGWCDAHYRRWNLYGDPAATRFKPAAICEYKECGRKVASRGLCDAHNDQRNAGTPLRPIAERRPTSERDAMGRKLCRSCREWKHLEHFHRLSTRGDGYTGVCKPCGRWRKIAAQYGLTARGYADLLAVQGGGCALCGRSNDDNGRPLAVDHDHRCCPGTTTCGKCVRGLLCNNCNHGIGLFGDDPDRMRRAASYLEEYGRGHDD